jgi:two-component system, NarL family, sensor histidine kinase UhpB
VLCESLSLRARLNLMIGLTMLLIIGLGFLFAIYSARRSVVEEVHSTVNLAMQLIEAGLAEHRDTDRPIAGWLSQLGHLDRTRHLRIQIRQIPSTVADHSPGKRSRSTAVPRWFVLAVAPEPVVATTRVRSQGQPDMLIRIEADAGDEIDEAWRETWGFLSLILVLAAAIYALVHITIGRAFRSVGVILEGLEEIDKGDYGKRLPHFSLPDFARISGAFNHMAATLDSARSENRALTQQSLAIQEEERRYLAQELHDELGQSLTAIKVLAASLRQSGGTAQEAVTQIMVVCDRLFGVVRGMMRRLRPLILDELGLAACLEDLVEHWRAHNPAIHLTFRCEEGVDECAGSAQIHLFRIVQEGLTNVYRHAAATRAWIELARVEEIDPPRRWIVLHLRDDGRGFDASQPRPGLGLLGIRERVAGLDGRFALEAGAGRGVSIEVMVPCGETLG